MINAFHEIVDHDNLTDFKVKLNRMEILHIFSPLYELYDDEDLVRRVVQYIAYCYSIESPKISVGGDWKREKQLVYQSVKLPTGEPEKIDDIIYLQSEIVRECVVKWMKYKDADQLAYLKTLQELYIQMQRGALSDIYTKGSESQLNYDQKQRCALHMKELRVMIKEATAALEQNSELLKPKADEVAVHTKPRREILGVEQFAQ